MSEELTPGQAPDSIVAAISSQIELDGTQVAAVLAAWNAITTGDAVSTVVRDSSTGYVGHRVSRNGVHMWAVTAPDGGTWFDMQPSLPGYTTLYEPQGS